MLCNENTFSPLAVSRSNKRFISSYMYLLQLRSLNVAALLELEREDSYKWEGPSYEGFLRDDYRMA